MEIDTHARAERRWRVIKSLLIAGVIATPPLYYLTANRLARSDWTAAQAAWNAADTPFKCGDSFKGSPAVPVGQNLLESGFFAELRESARTGTSAPRAFAEWGDPLRPPSGTPQHYAGGRFDGDALFVAPKGKPALLTETPDTPRAETVRTALEHTFPDLADLPARCRARPELTIGFTYPPMDNAFSAPMVSFRRARNAFALLLVHADASLRTRHIAAARCALDIALRYDALLTREPTLVHRAIGALLTKHTLHPLRTGLALGAFGESDLIALDARLADIRCLSGIRTALAEEATIWPAFYAIHGVPTTSYGALFAGGRSFPDLITGIGKMDADDWRKVASFLVPEGWLIDALTENLRQNLEFQTRALKPDGTLHLGELNRLHDRAKSQPDYPWRELALNNTPVFRKITLNAAAGETAVRGARLAIALERHRLRHGSFPEKLAALDADLLPGGHLPVGVVFGLPPEYTRPPAGGYSLVFKNEDAADSAPGKETTSARDIVWSIPPAPEKP